MTTRIVCEVRLRPFSPRPLPPAAVTAAPGDGRTVARRADRGHALPQRPVAAPRRREHGHQEGREL